MGFIIQTCNVALHVQKFYSTTVCLLTLSLRRSLSYRNQSIDLQSKSMGSFLYERDLPHKRVKIMGKNTDGLLFCWFNES